MTINDLKSKLAREPFRPFIIELVSGRRIAVGADSELLFPGADPDWSSPLRRRTEHEFENPSSTQ